MIVATTIRAVRARRQELDRLGRRVALVPTMGALHEGHLSLVREAARRADEVWVSIFVNPTQFGPNEDFDRYPRQLERDRELLEAEGVALLFAPTTKEMYPKPPSVLLDVPQLTAGLCGAHRPGHFRGVALVVVKLFNILRPEVAVFGAKDYQQATVIKRLVEELDLPVEVVVAPTVREADGLAMSSRNAYLHGPDRQAAAILQAALRAAAAALVAGERRGQVLEGIVAAHVASEPAARLQYAAAVHPDTLEPLETVGDRVVLAVAAFVGGVRLIDNLVVEVP
ncbi:MAG: pantoate--beta-alanine ligase [Thermoanaerobaculaceae bacterium]|nr:pantoate--beta-alanine ligase [Thermoanaerobaculaceae bacterium]